MPRPWLVPLLCFALFQIAWMTAVTTWVLWRVAPPPRPRVSPSAAFAPIQATTEASTTAAAVALPPLFTREGVPLYFETRRKQIETELRHTIEVAGAVLNTRPNCKVCRVCWHDIAAYRAALADSHDNMG